MSGRRLLSLVPRVGWLIVAKAVALWAVSLIGVGFVFTLAGYLAMPLSLIGGTQPHRAGSGKGTNVAQAQSVFAVPDGIAVFIELIVLIALGGYLVHRLSSFLGNKIAEEVDQSLYEQLYSKMLDLGAARRWQGHEEDFRFALGQGTRQIRDLCALLIPEVAACVLSFVSLFIVVACIDLSAAWPVLVCLLLCFAVVLFAWYRKNGKTMAWCLPALSVCLCLTFVCVDIIAVRHDIDGSLSLSSALPVIMLSSYLLIPMHRLRAVAYLAVEGLDALVRVVALLDLSVPVLDDMYTDVGAMSLVFDDVSLSRDRVDGVNHLSFHACPGHVTAIVGNGSSNMDAVSAMLDGSLNEYRGAIYLRPTFSDHLGNVALRSLSLPSLATAIGVVGPHVGFFQGSLRSNLAAAAPKADENDMWLALNRARLDGFVYMQADGLDMQIDADASDFGEDRKIKLALARALLSDCPVVVFDRVLDGLDARSTQLINMVIHELAYTKTVVLLTDDAHQAWDGDKIVQMDKSCVSSTQRSDEALEQRDSRRAEPSNAEIDAAGAIPAGATTVSSHGQDQDSVWTCLFAVFGRVSGILAPVCAMLALMAQNGHGASGLTAPRACVAVLICALMWLVFGCLEQGLGSAWCMYIRRGHPAPVSAETASGNAPSSGKLVQDSQVSRLDRDLLPPALRSYGFRTEVVNTLVAIICALVAASLNLACAIALSVAYILTAVVLRMLFIARVRSLKSAVASDFTKLSRQIDDDIRGLNEIIRLGQGTQHMNKGASRMKKLLFIRRRLSRKSSIFTGVCVIVDLCAILACAAITFTLGQAAAPGVVSMVLVFCSVLPVDIR